MKTPRFVPTWLVVVLSSGTSAFVMLVMVLGITSWAENTELDSGPRTIPYNGVLEFNGEAFTGPADIRFVLMDDDACRFEENHEDVQVFASRFSVNIGSVVGDLPACLFDADRVFLEMAVRGGNDETDHIPLAGRQRINPVPFAYWAAEGADFKIDGDARIGNSVTVGDDVQLDGADSQLRFTTSAFDSNGDVGAFGDYKLLLFQSNTPEDSYGLGIQGGTLFANSAQFHRLKVDGVDKFVIDGDTNASTLTGSLGVTGNIDAPTLSGITSINSGGLASSFGGALTVGGALSTGSLSTSGALSAASANIGALTASSGHINAGRGQTAGLTIQGNNNFQQLDASARLNLSLPGHTGFELAVGDPLGEFDLLFFQRRGGGPNPIVRITEGGLINAVGGVQDNGTRLFNIRCNFRNRSEELLGPGGNADDLRFSCNGDGFITEINSRTPSN